MGPLFSNIRSTIPLCMQSFRPFTDDGKMKQEIQGTMTVENSFTLKDTASRNASTATINPNDNMSAYSKSPSLSPVLESTHHRRHSSQKKEKTKLSKKKKKKKFLKKKKKKKKKKK